MGVAALLVIAIAVVAAYGLRLFPLTSTSAPSGATATSATVSAGSGADRVCAAFDALVELDREHLVPISESAIEAVTSRDAEKIPTTVNKEHLAKALAGLRIAADALKDDLGFAKSPQLVVSLRQAAVGFGSYMQFMTDWMARPGHELYLVVQQSVPVSADQALRAANEEVKLLHASGDLSCDGYY